MENKKQKQQFHAIIVLSILLTVSFLIMGEMDMERQRLSFLEQRDSIISKLIAQGEILEGHGNKYLKKYFAPAIAEEVGLEHLEEIQKIIDEKYKVVT